MKARKSDDADIMRKALTRAIWPYVVRRPNGGCQVLFPLHALDDIVADAIKRSRIGEKRR